MTAGLDDRTAPRPPMTRERRRALLSALAGRRDPGHAVGLHVVARPGAAP